MSDTLATGGAPSAPPADPGELGGAPAPRGAPAAPASQRVAPGSPEWAALTKEQRHEQLRGPANPRSKGHSPARDHREAVAERGAPPVAGDPARAEAARPPEGELAAEKFKIGKYEVSEADVGAMMERQALDDLRKATVPASPDAYRAELPPDLKLPGNVEYKLDASNPSLIAARNLAHAKGWSQQDFSEALAIFATHEAQKEFAMAERLKAEVAAVGPTATQRIDAIGRWITGMVGEKDAGPIRATICTAAHVNFYESVINKLTSQGGASFSQQHRVPGEDRGIPGYDKMSFAEKRHAQEQFRARGGR
jgi:hypothetical protein